MPRCRHSVLIKAFQYAVGEGHCSSCGAPLACMSTLFNSLTPVIISDEATPFVACILRNSFAVYRLAGTFRFTTSIRVCCDMWPAGDLRRMLTEEIDVVQLLVFVNPGEEHLDCILLDLPHLNSIHVTLRIVVMAISCTALARLFQQTTRRSLRRSIARTIARNPFIFATGLNLFAPLMLDALLGAETVDEFHDLLLLAMLVPDLPRQHEVDQFMALLSDYKNNFAESTQHPAPLGVDVAAFAAKFHAVHAVPFDFEPFFKYIWDKYYATGLIDELVADRERVRSARENPFEAPFEFAVVGQVVRKLFDGVRRDVLDATRGDVCIDAYFESDVLWYVNNLFRDERCCFVVFGNGCSMSEYDEKIVLFCESSIRFASGVKNHIFDFGWCRFIQRWAQRRVAHSTRLMHCKGTDRATAEKMVEAEWSAWNSIYEARLIAATFMFGCTDLQSPPRRAVEATQDLLYDLFDEDNELDDARLIPAFLAVLKAILLMPPSEIQDDNGQVVSTRSVLKQARVKEIFTFLTHAARRERMRIKSETVPKADDSNKDRRRSREQSEEENNENSNCSYRRYLPRLLEDNHLRKLMEQEAARGTLVVKDLLDELVSEEVIEI